MLVYRSFRIVLLGLTVTLLAFGCGKKKSDDTTSDIPDGSGSLATDTVGTTAASATGVDEASDAITDDASQSATGLALTTGDTDITVSRACTANSDGSVTVVATRSGTGSLSGTVRKTTFDVSVSGSGTDTRNWVPPTGQTLTCTTSSKQAKIVWDSSSVVTGLKLTDTVDNSLDRSRTLTKDSITVTTDDNETAKGTRSVTFSGDTTSGSQVTYTKTITITDMTRTKVFTNAAGTSVTLSVDINTDSSDPLVVNVVRDASTGDLVSKTIASGTLTATKSDGSYVSLDFSSVEFDFSSSTVCVPVSGSISGSAYTKGATTASETFTVNFDETSGDTITFKGQVAADLSLSTSGCDLQRES